MIDSLLENMAILQAGGAASMTPTLITFGLVFLIFYFLIIRPQNKKQKETKAMLGALSKGDRVVTIGGIRGIVHAVKDDVIIVRVDGETKLEFNKSAVSTVLDKKKNAGGGKNKEKAEVATPAETESDSEAADENK